VVEAKELAEAVPLPAMTGDADSLSSQGDDVTGVRDGVSGVSSEKEDTVDSDDAVDILRDSSDDDSSGVGQQRRRRFDSTVDFWTKAAITKAFPVACKRKQIKNHFHDAIGIHNIYI
jgi:hypothetical protein